MPPPQSSDYEWTLLCLKVQGSAVDDILGKYYWHYIDLTASPIIPELAYKLASIERETEIRKMY